MSDRRLPWHKMNAGKQNKIIIGVCIVIALVVIIVAGILPR
ncbi:hypothetical protein [Desulfosporosinus acidiphilus]|nr:hypothetical protein [Desulfosporosinus acidiphilus]